MKHKITPDSQRQLEECREELVDSLCISGESSMTILEIQLKCAYFIGVSAGLSQALETLKEL